jgi:hypothetical protein
VKELEEPPIWQVLDSTISKLKEALKDDKAGFTESTRKMVNDGIEAASILARALNALKEAKKPVEANPNDPSHWKDRPDGVNATLFQNLGVARERLSQARNLVAQAKSDVTLNESIKSIVEGLDADTGFGRDFMKLDQLLRRYEHLFEATAIASNDDVPIYARINRTRLEATRQGLENTRRQQALGVVNAIPDSGKLDHIRLARFYAEGNADFELIVGLARELPHLVRVAPSSRFRMKLVSDLGVETGEEAKIRFDDNTSTPSLLVFRASTPRLVRAGIRRGSSSTGRRTKHFSRPSGSTSPSRSARTGRTSSSSPGWCRIRNRRAWAC